MLTRKKGNKKKFSSNNNITDNRCVLCAVWDVKRISFTFPLIFQSKQKKRRRNQRFVKKAKATTTTAATTTKTKMHSK